MTQWTDRTTCVNKNSGKILHEVSTDGSTAQMEDVMGPARQYPTSHQDAIKKIKKRRKREAPNNQDEGSSFLPPATKSRIESLSNQETAFDHPPAQDITDTDLSSLRDYAEFEPHIAPSLIKSVAATCYITSINVISSSKIQSKVKTMIDKLASFSFVAATKPNIVLIRAKGAVASKLITIVEITKREIAKAGGKWYQYNVLSQILAMQDNSIATKGPDFTLGPQTKVDINDMEIDRNEDSQPGGGGQEEEETSFETMKTPLERVVEGKPKIHSIPMILIFLSRIRNDALKEAYGEQTNAVT